MRALVQGMGRAEPGRGPARLHHLGRQPEPADHRRRRRSPAPATTSWPSRPGSPPTYAAAAGAGGRRDRPPGRRSTARSTRPPSTSASADGTWRGVPAVSGTPVQAGLRPLRPDASSTPGSTSGPCGRPRRERGPGADSWNWETFLTAAEKCHAAGVPFGLPHGPVHRRRGLGRRAVPLLRRRAWWTRRATSPSATTRRCGRRWTTRCGCPSSCRAMSGPGTTPPTTAALISGRSALVFNPPSAWAVAQARRAAGGREVLALRRCPAGPEGRFMPYLPYFWGIWSFSRNKAAAKALLEFLSRARAAAEAGRPALAAATTSRPSPSMSDFKVWETEGPPVGIGVQLPDQAAPPGASSASPSPRRRPRSRCRCTTRRINTKMIARIAQGGETDRPGAGLGRARDRATSRAADASALTAGGRAGASPSAPCSGRGGVRWPRRHTAPSPRPARRAARSVSGRCSGCARRRSTIAFLMTLPLLAIIGGLVVYPFFYAIYLSTLNRG